MSTSSPAPLYDLFKLIVAIILLLIFLFLTRISPGQIPTPISSILTPTSLPSTNTTIPSTPMIVSATPSSSPTTIPTPIPTTSTPQPTATATQTPAYLPDLMSPPRLKHYPHPALKLPLIRRNARSRVRNYKWACKRSYNAD